MDELAGKKLVILGLARQGQALARYAAAAGARVLVSDLRPAEQLQAAIQALNAAAGIEFVLGDHPPAMLDGADLLAVSGGVPLEASIVQAALARGVKLTNDSLIFMQRTPAAVIGVTGSAGKTTTTALTGAICAASGRRTWVGGNIGRPLISDLEAMQPDDLVVQELSSFQLELWNCSPQIAAVLNITPNHLDRHKTMAAYANAKANIVRHQGPGGVVVLYADDPGAMGLAPEVNGRLRTFSHTHSVADGAFVRAGQIWLRDQAGRETAVCHLDDINLRGAHNVLNVLAAVTLADAAGVPTGVMAGAIRSFRGVAHRLELVATINGVQYVNDSIATAPERALAALEAFSEPLVLLAGGKDKNMVWEPWARRVRARVKQVILFGDLAALLEEKLNAPELAGLGDLRGIRSVNTLAEAVRAAAATAVAGDVVLLAPGGTSYDAFVDFEERGCAFRELVARLSSG